MDGEGAIPGTSLLSGLSPSSIDSVLRGSGLSAIEPGVIPTTYRNSANNTEALGYRLQYDYTEAGDSVDRANFHSAAGELNVRVRLRPTTQQFTMVVSMQQTWLDFIASCVSLGSGLAFLTRLTLWAYLRFLKAHAEKVGSSVKEALVERERQLRHLRDIRRRARSSGNLISGGVGGSGGLEGAAAYPPASPSGGCCRGSRRAAAAAAVESLRLPARRGHPVRGIRWGPTTTGRRRCPPRSASTRTRRRRRPTR